MPLRNPRPYSAIRVFDVPSAVHIVGAVLAAELWIGIVNDTGAPDKWREAGGSQVTDWGLGGRFGVQFNCLVT